MELEALGQMSAKDAFDTLNSCLIAYLRQSRPREQHPEMEKRILQEIKKISNHATLYSDWLNSIAQRPMSGRRREIIFEICGRIRSDELIPVIASYLEDGAIYDRLEDIRAGQYSPRNSDLAAGSLALMEIAEAPVKNKDPLFYTFDDVQAWRKWWSKRKDDEGGEGDSDPATNNDRGEREPRIEANSTDHRVTK